MKNTDKLLMQEISVLKTPNNISEEGARRINACLNSLYTTIELAGGDPRGFKFKTLCCSSASEFIMILGMNGIGFRKL